MIHRSNVRSTSLRKLVASASAGIALTVGSLCCAAASPTALWAESSADNSFSAVAEAAVPASDARVTVIADAASTPAISADIAREAIKPLYPEQARRDGIEGYVVVQFDITRGGAVSSARVIEAQPANYFETAAIDAVQRFQFVPNTTTTEPLAIRGAINKFVFSLHAPNTPASPGFIFHRGRTYYAIAQ